MSYKALLLLVCLITWVHPIKINADTNNTSPTVRYSSSDFIGPQAPPAEVSRSQVPLSKAGDRAERRLGQPTGSAVQLLGEKEQVMGLIAFYAGKYQVSETLALRIAFAESGFSPTARNKTSGACGVFQYLPSTWRNTPEGKAGRSCEDPEANIEAAIRHMSVHGTDAWNASKDKWK